ncbi:uncharacterized protein BDZ99DRAFT_286839 [Mytilinidion resinicola]|uniref:TPR-like protein n=1 Tax=Mytilinidion resinicola TaxID=574789 RepID=A0A6A6YRT8_9PEZI|nr:uncharacterized protein BDZ99DRAFT_286839 [Mytilinidion resinicola]KAF2810675.1 hypothetical protein BDZ99DRAFT_286839 [Mytilinidion resinicola]
MGILAAFSTSALAATYQQNGLLDHAVKVYKTSIENLKDFLPSHHEVILNQTAILAATYRALGRLQVAEAVLSEPLRLFPQVISNSARQQIRRQMIHVYSEMGHTTEMASLIAEEDEETNVQIAQLQSSRNPTNERRIKSFKAKKLHALEDLGICAFHERDYRKAEQALLQYLSLAEEMYGNKGSTTHGMLVLGELYNQIKRHEEAKRYLDLAIRIREKDPDEDYKQIYHLRIARLSVCSTLKERKEARFNTVKLLEECRARFGDTHDITLTALLKLIDRLNEQGQRNDAINLGRLHVELCGKTVGTQRPRTGFAKFRVALLLWDFACWDEAIEMQEEVVSIYVKAHGSNHPKTAQMREQLEWMKRGASLRRRIETLVPGAIVLGTARMILAFRAWLTRLVYYFA